MKTFATEIHTSLSETLDRGLRTGTPYVGMSGLSLNATIPTPAGNYIIDSEYAGLTRAFNEPRYRSCYARTWYAIQQGRAALSIILEGSNNEITLFKPVDIISRSADTSSYLQAYQPLNEELPTPDEAVAVITNCRDIEPMPYNVLKNHRFAAPPKEIDATLSPHLRALYEALQASIEL